jgi:hypothetical protein
VHKGCGCEGGQHGVLRKTTIDHYRKALVDFELKDMSGSLFLPRSDDRYSFSVWSKK